MTHLASFIAAIKTHWDSGEGLKMKKLLLALTVAAGSVAPAVAADMPVKAPRPVVVAAFSWTGFYIGGHAGYGWGKHHLDVPPIPSYSYDVDGFIGGGQAGYNWQSGAFVFGLEADVGYKGFKGDDAGFAGAIDAIKGRWGGTFRGRLGIASDRALFYVTGGLAWLNYRYSSTITPAGPGATFTNTDTGWTVGGGIEYAFASQWSAKVEYLYADYGDRNRSTPIFVNPWTTTLTTNEVRVGLNYKFGGPVVARY
jgi:outer membrane immunogenic protein